jgi:hypothetical protein
MIIDIKDINVVLICVIIVLVIFCLIRNEHFQASTTTCGNDSKEPYPAPTPFHPNVEETDKVDSHNFIVALTNNRDNTEIYGKGYDLPVASNDGV